MHHALHYRRNLSSSTVAIPGMSAFALDDGLVYRTYSSYARGLDALWGAYQWLDRAPLGRNETGFWWRQTFRSTMMPRDWQSTPVPWSMPSAIDAT